MNFDIQLDKRFKDKAKGRFGKYSFEVGILKDAPHKRALSKSRGTKRFHGGPARRTGTKSRQSIGATSKIIRKKYKYNYLVRPFDNKKSADILKFTKEFFSYVFGRSEQRRVVNLLQAIVRNPILRGDYGPNAPSTIKKKGFNRFMIDTGQLFSKITAKARVNRV